jgi:hypothetical protein
MVSAHLLIIGPYTDVSAQVTVPVYIVRAFHQPLQPSSLDVTLLRLVVTEIVHELVSRGGK